MEGGKGGGGRAYRNNLEEDRVASYVQEQEINYYSECELQEQV